MRLDIEGKYYWMDQSKIDKILERFKKNQCVPQETR